MSRDAEALGASIARALAGSWRTPPPPLDPSLSAPELERVIPPIVHSGSAGLLWRRLPPGASSPSLEGLRATHRQQILDGALQVHQLKQVLAALRDDRIVPLLLKGWSVARLYPERGLRPSLDIDLVVSPSEIETARRAVARVGPVVVDLHPRIPHLGRRDPAAIQSRLRTVDLDGLELRLLGDEDQLHLLCLHLLVHGGWRTIWLCDLGVCVEGAGPGFDWGYFLGDDPRDAAAVTCAIGLAARLLDVKLDGTPLLEAPRRLPAWMVPALLSQWARDEHSHDHLVRIPRSPSQLLREARRRWPNPIRATAALRGPFNGWPRLPIQLTEFLLRTYGWWAQSR